MMTSISTTPVAPARPLPLSVAAPGALTPPPQDSFKWSNAIALPAYTFGAGAAAISSLSGFADRFPAGGVTINPNGIIANPEWTRNFAEGSTLRGMQPIVAAFGAGIFLVRGALEMREGLQSGCGRTQLAGALDLSLAAASALQIVHPGLAGAASVALVVARGVIEAH